LIGERSRLSDEVTKGVEQTVPAIRLDKWRQRLGYSIPHACFTRDLDGTNGWAT
jgi:hypothetical protein